MNIIVGTAGHIDHGKTALIRALTGIDADRLPEEKLRGITIDIGFAELKLGDLQIGFVDVPGHERFVKNMLAGASGIDLVLLVIAANEGVMPQTREHFDICRLLGIKSGVVVITKTDLADEELLELVNLDAAELVENSFLENAPVISVSAKTGDGIEQLKAALSMAASGIPDRSDDLIARLPIDRSFTVKGFGAVVTGTLASGQIKRLDEMELLPSGRRVRVRGLQAHGREAETADAGQRTAVNLGGIDHNEIERGMLLSESGILRPTHILDAEIEVLKNAKKPLRSRQRLRVHIGTVEAIARVQVLNETGEIAQGNRGFVQIRLEMPVAAVPGERLILRSYSPQITIAGGTVLDAQAAKHRKKDVGKAVQFLQNIYESPNPAVRVRILVEAAEKNLPDFGDLQARTGWRKNVLRKAIDEYVENGNLVDAGGVYVSRIRFEELKSASVAEIENHHVRRPLSIGIPRETLREKVFSYVPEEVFRHAIAELIRDGKIRAENDVVMIAGRGLAISPEETEARQKLASIYLNAGLSVPTLDEALKKTIEGTKIERGHARRIFQLLINTGEIIKVSEEFYFSKAAIEGLRLKMLEFASRTADRLIDVAGFKEIAGVSRKYAIPLLEYFDREHVTRRAGDKRLILQ